MIDNLKSYYSERCDVQRRLAENATSPEIADIHRSLIDRYAMLAERSDHVNDGSQPD